MLNKYLFSYIAIFIDIVKKFCPSFSGVFNFYLKFVKSISFCHQVLIFYVPTQKQKIFLSKDIYESAPGKRNRLNISKRIWGFFNYILIYGLQILWYQTFAVLHVVWMGWSCSGCDPQFQYLKGIIIKICKCIADRYRTINIKRPNGYVTYLYIWLIRCFKLFLSFCKRTFHSTYLAISRFPIQFKAFDEFDTIIDRGLNIPNAVSQESHARKRISYFGGFGGLGRLSECLPAQPQSNYRNSTDYRVYIQRSSCNSISLFLSFGLFSGGAVGIVICYLLIVCLLVYGICQIDEGCCIIVKSNRLGRGLWRILLGTASLVGCGCAVAHIFRGFM